MPTGVALSTSPTSSSDRSAGEAVQDHPYRSARAGPVTGLRATTVPGPNPASVRAATQALAIPPAPSTAQEVRATWWVSSRVRMAIKSVL